MKKFHGKFLSVLISAILILTSVMAAPLSASATAGDESTTIQPIFESLPLENDYKLNDKNGVNDVNLWLTTGNLEAEDLPSDTEVKYDQGNLIKFHNYFASNKILEDNDYAGDTSEITDFVWEFDYRPGNAQYANVSFLFHVNENSHIPTGSEQPRSTIRNVMGVSFFGYNATKTDAENVLNTLRIDAPSASGAYESADNYTSGSTKTTRSYVSLSRNSGTYIYTIRIVLKGNSLIASIWEKSDKAGTYRSVYYEYTAEEMALAPNGDFAIVQGNTSGFVKDMKIYNGTDVLLSGEDYSEYDQLIAPTKYTFDTDTDGVEKTDASAGTLAWNEDTENGALLLDSGDDNNSITTKALDAGNDNLGDFILKYDFTCDGNWTNDYVLFRTTDSNNTYRLRVRKNGTSANADVDYIQITKVVAGEETTILGEVRLSRSITRNQKYTIKLDVQGNTFKVYFAQAGSVYNEPILTATDNTYTTGYLHYYHLSGPACLDNIEIYDITAYNAAKTINEEAAKITERGMDNELLELQTLYLDLHATQKAKLTAQKAAIDAAEARLEQIEYNAHDANGDSDVDICDLVMVYKHLAEELTITTATFDPVFDNLIDVNDMHKVRTMLLQKKN